MKRTALSILLLPVLLFIPLGAGASMQRGGRGRRNKAFSIHWNSMSALPKPPPPEEGEKKTKKKTPFLFPKPVLVYLSSPDPKSQKNQDYLEHLVFRDARVGLGSHFFLCARGNESDIPQDPLWKKLLGGKKFPRIVVISRDRKIVLKVEGRIKSSQVLSAMQRVVSWDYKSPSFHYYINELRKTLIQLGSLRKTAQWMEKVQHSGRTFKRPQLLYLQKQQKKVLALIKKLEAKEKKLRDLKLKKRRD